MGTGRNGSRACIRFLFAAQFAFISDCRLHIKSPLQTGQDAILSPEQGHYLRQVMRLRCGDKLVLFDGSGGEYQAEITRLAKQHSACHVQKFDPVEREFPCHVHIVQSAVRSDKLVPVLQKGTELGAAGFQITRSERTPVKFDGGKLDRRLQRWQSIITEAAEQSGRTRIPYIRWRSSLPDIKTHGSCFALHTQTHLRWPQARQAISQASEITFAIGSEGGWSHRDIKMLEELGFTGLRFGPRIMRTETAAPALLAAIQACLD